MEFKLIDKHIEDTHKIYIVKKKMNKIFKK